jgi:hypothetical protein
MTTTKFTADFCSWEKRIKSTRDWWELLGENGRTDKAMRSAFREVSAIVHPDVNNGHPRAELAFKLLGEWRTIADKALNGTKAVFDNGVLAQAVTFKTKRGPCVLNRMRFKGSGCLIYTGALSVKEGDVPVYARVPRSFKDNDLMQREVDAYSAMAQKLKTMSEESQKYLAWRIPFFDSSVKLSEPGKPFKQLNLFRVLPDYTEGWFSAAQIQAKYPDGVDPRVAAFIWNRMLEALTLAHAARVYHGNIAPQHVLIHAATHAGNLIDWTASSSKVGQSVAYQSAGNRPMPEWHVLGAPRLPSAHTDLFQLAWVLAGLLGRRFLEAPEGVRYLLNKCVQPDPGKRFRSASVLHEELKKELFSAYGKPTFVKLNM